VYKDFPNEEIFIDNIKSCHDFSIVLYIIKLKLAPKKVKMSGKSFILIESCSASKKSISFG